MSAPDPHRRQWLIRLLRQSAGWCALAGTARAEAPGAPPAESVLRVALSSARAQPYIAWHNNLPVGGLDWQLAQAVAERLGWRAEAVVLPPLRLRLAALAGEFDLLCGADPLRLPDAEPYEWSRALAESPELLLGHRNAEPVDSVEQLAAGAVVGTPVGHLQPLLEQRFQDGRLVRDETQGEERLLLKLQARRHPYAVLSMPALRAQLADERVAAELGAWRLPVGSVRYHCAVPRRGRLSLSALNGALDTLRQNGRWAALSGDLFQDALAVVVSTQSPLRNLEPDEVKDVFAGRRQQLPGGLVPHLMLLRGPDRARFIRSQLGREPADFQAAWTALQFGGRARAPSELPDVDSMRQRLRNDPQGLGVLPLSAVGNGLRVVALG